MAKVFNIGSSEKSAVFNTANSFSDISALLAITTVAQAKALWQKCYGRLPRITGGQVVMDGTGRRVAERFGPDHLVLRVFQDAGETGGLAIAAQFDILKDGFKWWVVDDNTRTIEYRHYFCQTGMNNWISEGRATTVYRSDDMSISAIYSVGVEHPEIITCRFEPSGQITTLLTDGVGLFTSLCSWGYKKPDEGTTLSQHVPFLGRLELDHEWCQDNLSSLDYAKLASVEHSHSGWRLDCLNNGSYLPNALQGGLKYQRSALDLIKAVTIRAFRHLELVTLPTEKGIDSVSLVIEARQQSNGLTELENALSCFKPMQAVMTRQYMPIFVNVAVPGRGECQYWTIQSSINESDFRKLKSILEHSKLFFHAEEEMHWNGFARYLSMHGLDIPVDLLMTGFEFRSTEAAVADTNW